MRSARHARRSFYHESVKHLDAAGRFDGGIRGRARFDSDGTARFAAIPEAEFP
jgi:hypothetical protein